MDENLGQIQGNMDVTLGPILSSILLAIAHFTPKIP
jgi:hypothetical protein